MPQLDNDRTRALQKHLNSTTREHWDRYESHRLNVTRLLLERGSPTATTAALLGAGNLNDVDLPQLFEHYQNITLVDIDDQAVLEALKRLGIHSSSIEVAPSTDLSCYPDHQDTIIKTYDLVASLCMITQMMDSLLHQEIKLNDEIIRQLRQAHYEQIISRMTPDGIGFIITDVVSSIVFPRLAEANSQQLIQIVQRAIVQKIFQSGADPLSIMSELQNDTRLKNISLINPWIWDLGPQQLAVCAIRFERKQY